MQVPSTDEYQDLANAIVQQAATDYRNALRGKGYRNKSPEAVLKELRKFFRSSYYNLLTNVDGEYLMEQLEKEYLENKKEEK